MWHIARPSFLFIIEEIKQELKIIHIYGCRCNERLKAKTETCTATLELLLEQEMHAYLRSRLIELLRPSCRRQRGGGTRAARAGTSRQRGEHARAPHSSSSYSSSNNKEPEFCEHDRRRFAADASHCCPEHTRYRNWCAERRRIKHRHKCVLEKEVIKCYSVLI